MNRRTGRERPFRPRLGGCLLWFLILIAILLLLALFLGGFRKGKPAAVPPLRPAPVAQHLPSLLHEAEPASGPWVGPAPGAAVLAESDHGGPPELYRHYVTLDVQLVFHSFHAGHVPPDQVAAISDAIGPQYAPLNPAATFTYPGITMPAVMTASAACNHLWISCPNSSAPESLWPAFFVRPDGITTGRLERNTPGVLISIVDTSQDLYDSTGPRGGAAPSPAPGTAGT